MGMYTILINITLDRTLLGPSLTLYIQVSHQLYLQKVTWQRYGSSIVAHYMYMIVLQVFVIFCG